MDLNNLDQYQMFKQTLDIKFYFKRVCVRSNNIIKKFSSLSLLDIITEFVCIDDRNHEIYNQVPCFIIRDPEQNSIQNVSTDENIENFTNFLLQEINKINNITNNVSENKNIDEQLSNLMASRDSVLTDTNMKKQGSGGSFAVNQRNLNSMNIGGNQQPLPQGLQPVNVGKRPDPRTQMKLPSMNVGKNPASSMGNLPPPGGNQSSGMLMSADSIEGNFGGYANINANNAITNAI